MGHNGANLENSQETHGTTLQLFQIEVHSFPSVQVLAATKLET